MKKSEFAPIENYRKHNKITGLLGKTGKVELITELSNKNSKQYYSGKIAIVDLDGFKITVPVHSENINDIKPNDMIKLSLRLETVNQAGLRNYGLVAKKI